MHPFPVRQGLHLNFFEFRLSKTLAFKTRQRENEFYFCMGIKNHFHINGFSSRKKKRDLGQWQKQSAYCTRSFLFYSYLELINSFRK